jgi:hypothetical protein
MTSIDDTPEPEAEEGDVAVPANATVAANVLSGTSPAEADEDDDQGN